MQLGESGGRLEGPPALSFERPRLLSVATAREYARLRRSHRWTYEAVNRQRQERLRVMVSHARRSVPVYRELYAGLPEHGPIELERLPLVDKSTFRAASEAERLAGPRPALVRTLRSSGTTGQPLAAEWSPRAAWWQGVLTLRMASGQGLSPIHRRAVLVGVPDSRPVGSGLFATLRRRHVHLTVDQSAESLAQALEKVQPHAVFGHGHILVEIGEHLTGGWRPKVINPAGEQLTPENRDALKRLYGSEPLDVYSSSEQGLVAWQCSEADLYHINHEAVCVEVLDEHGTPVPPGTAGALVITGLTNALMPLLRYRTGDVGVMATRDCRCGHRQPALAEVQGREMDWLVDARDRRVAPQRLWLSAHVTDGLSLVHRYQVRQSASKAVTISLVPRRPISEAILRELVQSYKDLLGEGIDVKVWCTEKLENEPSGKFRTIVTESAPPSYTGSAPAVTVAPS